MEIRRALRKTSVAAGAVLCRVGLAVKTVKQKSFSRIMALKRLIDYLLTNFWVFQTASAPIIFGCYFLLWYSQNSGSKDSEALVHFSAAILPVLAITSAISLIGANSYISRHNSARDILDLFNRVTKIAVEVRARIEGHPRDNKYQRQRFVSWLFSRNALLEFHLSPPRALFFTLRPRWDGAWFYGDDEYNRTARDFGSFQAAHELLICAVTALRLVLRLQDRHLNSITPAGGGMQGSSWFLERLERIKVHIKKDVREIEKLSRKLANAAVNLAIDSSFYMFNEFSNQKENLDWDEYEKIEFLAIFSDYMAWTNFVFLKYWTLRVREIGFRFPAFAKRLDEVGGKVYQAILDSNREIFAVQDSIAPYRAIIGRIRQMRLGSIIPIILTALGLFGYSVLFAISSLQAPNQSLILLGDFCYSAASTAIVENFLCALWILFPRNQPDLAQLDI